jgi:hypothetical protein
MTLADREIPKDETIPIEVSEMAVSLNRLHFYCGIDTIRQSTRMGEILSTSYARALKAKMPSMFIGEEIKAVDIRIAALESMNDRFQQEIVALLGTDSLSPLLINHRQQLATNFGSIAEFYSKKVALAKARYQAIEACRDVIAQDLKGVYEAMRAVLLMARRELAFPIDEVEYAALLTQSTDSALAQMESLIKDVRTEINKMMV